jgi:type IV pilus assembly protein PilA
MKNQKGFTLVELMVVMAIIAILSTAGISQYGRFIKSARDTTRVADLNALNIVILDSIQATGTVPADVDGVCEG